ncbi:MAG: PEP-CTERM sorting domain-containing protein [Planctomycetota bacterium]|nr:PEP-CTERM sorting domain-containing protein [Planctomycetota bacterium]
MRTSMVVLGLAGVMLAFGLAGEARATSTVVFQADLYTTGAPIHSGWTGITGAGVGWGPFTYSYVLNGINVDVSDGYANQGWRNRGLPDAGPLSDMYQGLLFAAAGMDIKLSGLTTGAQYQLNIYSWDSSGSNTGDAHWNYSLAGDKSSPVDAGYVWQPNTSTFTPAANTDTTLAGKGTAMLSTTFTTTGAAVDFFVVGGPVIALNGFELYQIQTQTWPDYLPGDFNKDGEVGPEDFGILKDNFGLDSLPFGAHESWTLGDANDDGEIGPEDFGLLKDNFGLDGGPTGTYPLTNVPEPTTLALLALAGLAIRRRQR